jgi:hypothetical protein
MKKKKLIKVNTPKAIPKYYNEVLGVSKFTFDHFSNTSFFFFYLCHDWTQWKIYILRKCPSKTGVSLSNSNWVPPNCKPGMSLYSTARAILEIGKAYGCNLIPCVSNNFQNSKWKCEITRSLRFSYNCFWRFKFSQMSHHVNWQTVTSTSSRRRRSFLDCLTLKTKDNHDSSNGW